MVSSATNADINIDGGFDFELSGKEYDPFIEASVYGSFAHYGTAGLGATFSCTTAATSITAGAAPSGTSAFTVLANGSWIKLNPPSGASTAIKTYFADRWFKVSGTTSTVITLDASTPIAGAGLGITAVAGYAVTQSVVSNGNTVKSFTFEYVQADIGQRLWFKGMQTNTLSLKLEVGSIITGSLGFIGMSHDIGATSVLPGTPVASQPLEVMNAVTDVGMVKENGSNLLTAGSFIKSVSLEINNNLRAQKAVGVYGNVGIGAGELAVSAPWRCTLPTRPTTASVGRHQHQSGDWDGRPGGNGYLLEMDKVVQGRGVEHRRQGRGRDAVPALRRLLQRQHRARYSHHRAVGI